MNRPAAAGAEWRDRAACAGHDTAIWFTSNGQSTTAKQICGRCPVRAECLYDALKTEPSYHRYGMWGGLTAQQRNSIPALPTPRTAALAALREVFDRLPDSDSDPQPERTDQPMTTTSSPGTAPTEAIPTGKLLKWGDDHPDPQVQDQAARARAALLGLRKRYAADQELTAITTEAEQLEKRLAELRAREAELKPAKARAKGGPRKKLDFDTRVVRAWALENGVECPVNGRVPNAVAEKWRAATQTQTA
ncbi:WhiB family transcriptional regulator [Streptomyces sp. NPDC002573]|uniref:WhiB family transcriptional regulator n=1 Tax=Streptomyces sp. NPDC002573 TaxID=3364651 RepID=UPI0036BFD2CF